LYSPTKSADRRDDGARIGETDRRSGRQQNLGDD
jgi:hypothetical protein